MTFQFTFGRASLLEELELGQVALGAGVRLSLDPCLLLRGAVATCRAAM